MARNPIAVNKGGLFRFSDFMSYVPDFLKTEQDVVTLMQLFSDYINNAYRNVDVSRKFYFNFTATESVLGKVKEKTKAFIEKLRKCETSNLYVYFLSLPRTNVNTNSTKRLTYINAPIVYNGEYKDTLQLSLLMDMLEEYNPDGNSIVSDGDVIYVKYSNGDIYPYYVDKTTGTLKIDSMNSSQDPFHDTVNNYINGTPRAIKFLPKNVGEMIVTEIGEIDGVTIYDIKIEFSVDDVQSISTHYIDEQNGDSVEVDYYGYLKGKTLKYDYYVSLESDNISNPLNWITNSPRGIFYFKELRDYVNGNSVDTYRAWKILKVHVLENGTTCYATLNSVSDLKYGDKITIESDEVIGTNSETGTAYKLNGTFSVTSSLGNIISFELQENGSTVILSSSVDKYMTSYNRVFIYSLYYERTGYDVNNYTVKLQWSSTIGEQNLQEGTIVYPYDMVNNTNIGILSPLMNSESYIQIDESINLDVSDVFYLSVNDNGLENDIKDEWLDENASILYVPLKVIDKRGNRLFIKDISTGNGIHFYNECVPSGDDDESIEKRRVANLALKLDVIKITSGFGTTYTLTDEDDDAIIYASDRIPEEGDLCFINELNIDDYVPSESARNSIYTITSVTELDTNKYRVTFDKDIESDSDSFRITLTYLQKDSSSYAVIGSLISNNFAYCYEHVNDIYTHDYWIDESLSFAMKCAYKDELGNIIDIQPYDSTKSYNVGDYIYYNDGLIYKSIDTTSSSDEASDNPVEAGKFIQYMYNVADMTETTTTNEYMYGLYTISELEYGETVDTSVYTKYNEILNTIFIEKADDNSLYFTWKDRDYLLNQYSYNTSGKHRNGFAEFYTTGDSNDIVTDTAESYSIATSIPSDGVTVKGLDSITTLKYSKYIIAEKVGTGKYKFTFNYTSHCLPNNALIRLSGAGSVDGFDFDTDENAFDRITVVNNDEFYFTRNVDYDADRIISTSASSTIEHFRSFFNPISTIEYYYQNYENYKAGYLYVSTKYAHGYSLYTKVTLENAPSGTLSNAGWISEIVKDKKIDIIVDENTYAIAINQVYAPSPSKAGQIVLQYGGDGNSFAANSYSVVTPEDGDCVKVGDSYYKVSSGEWEKLSGDSIYTPFVLYTHQNLMDVSNTNLQSAVAEDVRIDKIYFDGYDTVKVITRSPMNLVAKKSAVYISYVYPLTYCGRFVVDEVFTRRMFSYKVVPYSISVDTGTNINDGLMKCMECGWYKYTVSEVMFNMKSKYDIYKYATKIVDNIESSSEINNLIVTETPHGYEEDDRIILNVDGTYTNAIVDEVLSNVSFTYKGAVSKDFSGGYVFKGVYIESGDHSDNVEPKGLYSQALKCLKKENTSDDGVCKFEEGDIVFANDQLATDIPNVYCVQSGVWKPCTERRIMKIKDIDVDKYHNTEWDTTTDYDHIDEYVYRIYSYSEIIEDAAKNADNGIMSYIMPFHVRNYNFKMPTIEHLDTTEQVDYQFNSKHDYASIAPRYDFEDDSFKGIPDMKYPLVEKMERLIYLRDANVIDYELIGYLARFMGYDITDAKNNIDSSIVYKTNEQKEAAVRETVANLPQYYALGGTKAGLEMLLTTFGIVADVITMWTDLNRPYKELIEEGNLQYRTDSDYENGIVSQWAPTPHVKVRISTKDNFRTSFANEEEFNNLIKNIKAWKPIQVVFDEFIKYVDTAHGNVTLNNVAFANSGKMNIDLNYEIYAFEDEITCE